MGRAGSALLALIVGVDDAVAPPANASHTAAPPGLVAGAPTTPPARVGGDAAILAGPATPPAGAVRIDPGTSLGTATQANLPGTTFWLAPGPHTLGTGPFDEVEPKDGNRLHRGARRRPRRPGAQPLRLQPARRRA